MSYCLILTTASSLREARKTSKLLLEERLAACVTLLPNAESHYCWKGKRKKAREWLLLIKSESRLYRRIEKVVHQNHSYQIPELLALPISQGSRKYLSWISSELAGL